MREASVDDVRTSILVDRRNKILNCAQPGLKIWALDDVVLLEECLFTSINLSIK